MKFEEYYELLRKIENQNRERNALLEAIKGLEEIVSMDKKQTVKSRMTTSWRNNGETFGEYTINLNVKLLLEYYKKELKFQNKKHSILLERINKEKLE